MAIRIPIRCAAAALTLLLACACSRPGVETAPGTTESDQTATATTGAAAPPSSEESALPDYGVLETSRRPVAAGETTCEPDTPPAHPVEARTQTPGSPTVVIDVPDGFAPGAPPAGDTALNLTGPDGMTAAVLISPTTLDAAAAFRQYADRRTADYEINSVSVLPGELCGYSGQELMGMLADQPGQGIDYTDRIVHVWTGAGDYLVAVQVQAPNKTAGLDDATSTLLADFGIRMAQ